MSQKYGLVWEDKREELEGILESKEPVLVEDESMYIKGGLWSPNHRIIEGDNLASMTALINKGEKFEFIYGDPPYQTMNSGSSALTYKDARVDKNDKYKHSEWLSFMEKRLVLARELLAEDGVIFLSIDDRQVYRLKMLMDEVFGEENFICDFKWRKKATPSYQMVNNLSKMHENVLCYGKEYSRVKFNKRRTILEDEDKLYNKDDNDGRGKYYTRRVSAPENRSREKIKVKSPYGVEYEFMSFLSRESIEELDREGKIVWSKDASKPPVRKEYLKDRPDAPQIDLLTGREYGFNQTGTLETVHILGTSAAFSFPKPVKLIKSLIEMVEFNKGIKILDIFSGSGTTGHAVLDVNKKSPFVNEFTLLNISEESEGGINICKEITYERMKRVILGYNTRNGVAKKKKTSQLRYYTLDFKDKSKTAESKE